MRRATVGAAPNRATQIDNSHVKSAVATEKRFDRTTSVVAWLQKPGLAHTDASGCLNNESGIESIIQPISYRLQRFENYTTESPMARFRLLISIRNPFAASIFLIRHSLTNPVSLCVKRAAENYGNFRIASDTNPYFGSSSPSSGV